MSKPLPTILTDLNGDTMGIRPGVNKKNFCIIDLSYPSIVLSHGDVRELRDYLNKLLGTET